jgi:hypothetical protein
VAKQRSRNGAFYQSDIGGRISIATTIKVESREVLDERARVQGVTCSAIISALLEARADQLERLAAAHPEERPRGPKVTVGASVSRSLLRVIQSAADGAGVSRAHVVALAIADALGVEHA